MGCSLRHILSKLMHISEDYDDTNNYPMEGQKKKDYGRNESLKGGDNHNGELTLKCNLFSKESLATSEPKQVDNSTHKDSLASMDFESHLIVHSTISTLIDNAMMSAV